MGAIVCPLHHSPRHRSSSRYKRLFRLRDCFCDFEQHVRPFPNVAIFEITSSPQNVENQLGAWSARLFIAWGWKILLSHCCVHKLSNSHTTVAHYPLSDTAPPDFVCLFPMTLHRNPITFHRRNGSSKPSWRRNARLQVDIVHDTAKWKNVTFETLIFVTKALFCRFCSMFNWFINLPLSLKPMLCTFVNNNSFCVHIKMQISLKSLLQFVLMSLWAILWKMMS